MKAAADEEKATINKGAGHDKEIRDKGKEILEKALADRVEKSPDLGKPNCNIPFEATHSMIHFAINNYAYS